MADGIILPPLIQARAQSAARWRAALIVLGIGLVLLGVVFAEEGAAAIHVWNTNAAYNHCWLVPLIAGWLAWGRRDRLAAVSPRLMPVAALLILPAALAWLAAERLGVMEGRQLVAMGMAWVLVLAVLGWRVCLVMAAPLSYLIFMVPFGAFAVPMLQGVTAWMIELGLHAWGITHFRDGLQIETRAGLFHVAEACAGLRFLIAALAFGALYAFVMFRSPGRRIVIMVLALTVPVLANGIRALGIVVAAEYLGSAEAAAADHVIYGWGFFSAIILLLIGVGLPFREDTSPAPRRLVPPPHGGPAGTWAHAVAAGLVVLLAAAGPAMARVLDAGAGVPQEITAQLAAPEGCAAAEGGLRCPGATITARLQVFSSHVTWRAVSVERWRSIGGTDDTDITFTPATPPGGALWRARQANEALTATAAWLDGRPVGDGLRSRVGQALNSLGIGAGGVPVLGAIEMRLDATSTPARDRALLERVLAAQEEREGLTVQATGLSWRH